MSLEVRALRKRFAAGRGREVVALADVSLRLPGDAYTCVMGASGSGKTTLLRVIAGLEQADAGDILLDGRSIAAQPAERRPIHTVFQGYALFPHLDVAANVGFAPRVRGRRGIGLQEHVETLLRDVGLDDPALRRRRPAELSGGQQQRVALARALAGAPRVLLLDEPLAALDRPLRAELRRVLRAAQRARAGCFVHVTHDPEEALALADHLVLLAAGRVIAAGDPATIYARPPTLEVARLLGELSPLPDGAPGRWIRPERLRILELDARDEDPALVRRARATVRDRVLLGDRHEFLLDVAGRPCVARGALARVSPGDEVALEWRVEDELELADG